MMGKSTRWRHVVLVAVLIAFVCLGLPGRGLREVEARRHQLALAHENRPFFVISSFGLLKDGNITVTISNVAVHEPLRGIGLSVHRDTAARVTYRLEATDVCVFSQHLPYTDADAARFPFVLNSDYHFVSWGAPLEELDGLAHTITQRQVGNTTVHELRLQVASSNAEDLYTLAFHICNIGRASVDIEIGVVEVNPGPEYLGAGLTELPEVYQFTSFLFGTTSIVWIYVLVTHRDSPNLYKIHFLMLLLVLIKTLSSAFHGVDFYFVDKTGAEDEGWAITYYVISFAKGILLFVTVLFVGVGYGVVKRVLTKQEKRLFAVVLTLQVIANVAIIVLDESSQGSQQQSTWSMVAFIVDLICCIAIVFPIVWSMEHLQQTALVDGKAAYSLEKLRIFRRFYLLVLGYIYLTRIVLYFAESSLPFRLRWLATLFSEAITLAVYCVTGYIFFPTATNEYVQMTSDAYDSDDEDDWGDGNEERGFGGVTAGRVFHSSAPNEGLRKIRHPRIAGRDIDEEQFVA